MPVLAFTAFLLALLTEGFETLAARLLVPRFALGLAVVFVALAIVRVVAIWDARRIRGADRAGRAVAARNVALSLVLSVIVIGVHGAVAYYAWAFYDADSQIFVAGGADGSGGAVGPLGTQGGPSSAPSPEATPYATPATASSRLNMLMLGVDSGENRTHALTDTMLVVSVDPVSKQVAMLSIPRDVSNFPLYGGGTYPGKLNSLMTYAADHPAQFPDGPLTTLEREVGFILGIPIHYYASINLDGFRQMVDAVGGVDVVNPKLIYDPLYHDFPDQHVFSLSAGPHHLDGWTALAYVRSRQGIGDSDFTRAARQQQVLVALRAKLTQPAMLAKLPSLLKAASQTIRTDFPSGQVGDMVALARTITDTGIQRFVLGPPYAFHPPNNQTGGVYTLQLNMDKIKALSIRLFGPDSAYYQASTASPTP
ncbi:MAG: LCP family protein [Candidatus Limnocylindrales bacterium]